MKKKKRLPDFNKMTYQEEARFWDTHNVTDYEDETENVEIIFDLQKPKDETLVLRLQKGTKQKLAKKAQSKGLTTSSLARLWLLEKLHSAKP